MKSTVIVATYNYAEALALNLVGLEEQTERDFDVIIADDGSGPEVREVIAAAEQRGRLAIRHVWQEDRAMRKGRIVNRAVGETDADLLLFLDNDVIPQRDWFEVHRRAHRANGFSPGGHVRLERDQTDALNEAAVRSRDFEHYLDVKRRRELRRRHWHSQWAIWIGDRTRPHLFGMNFSVDRDLFERVNGYDLAYEGYGQEESDLRTRMRRAGGRARSLWNRAIVYHMWHAPQERGERAVRNRERYLAQKRGELPWRCTQGLAESTAD